MTEHTLAEIEHRIPEVREELQRLNRLRRQLVRRQVGGAQNAPIGLSTLIRKFATRKFPSEFTPQETLAAVKNDIPDLTINRVNAQLSRLVRTGKLRRVERGRYALA
jgi:hypothetical protein